MDYLLYGMSFANLQLLLASIPEMDFEEEEAEADTKKSQRDEVAGFFSKATF